MAHSASLKAACRAAYIDNMPLTQIAKAQNVPLATLRSWKRRALERGDDWDKLRAANLLAGEGMEAVARQTLSDYVLQHKALMGEIIEAQDMTAREKTQALASGGQFQQNGQRQPPRAAGDQRAVRGPARDPDADRVRAAAVPPACGGAAGSAGALCGRSGGRTGRPSWLG